MCDVNSINNNLGVIECKYDVSLYYVVDDYGLCKITESFRRELDNGLWDNKELPPIPDNCISLENLFNCIKAKRLNLSKFDLSNVISISGMFSNCYYLEELVLWFCKVPNLKYMVGTFSYCKMLKHLDISKSFVGAEPLRMDFAFAFMESLVSIDLSAINTSNVLSVYSMFYCCKCLCSINLLVNDFSNVKDFSCLFERCGNLKELIFSNFKLLQNHVDFMNMCYNNVSLDKVILPEFSNDSKYDMYGIFYGCSSLKSLNVDVMNEINSDNLISSNKISYFFHCDLLEDYPIWYEY